MGEFEEFTRKLERKLPGIMVTDPFSFEREKMDYRLEQYKKLEPERFNQRKIKLATDVLDWKLEVNKWFESRKRH